MLLAPKKGFVFLAMTKSASTAIETAFGPYADVWLRTNPFKHTIYEGFMRLLEPYLDWKGFPRDSYEVTAVMRDPIDWLASWWRFRTRKALARRAPEKYAGDVTFDDFARAYLLDQRGETLSENVRFAQQMGRPSDMLRIPEGAPPIDRIFRYDRIDVVANYFSDKVGAKVSVGVENRSPKREVTLSDEVRRQLTEFYAPEYEIYNNAESD